ncbi:hypothetical protein [Novosphingobium sp. PC22D]|uniref:hypothetical protein n=1 Tax=Novosphingobium sp. PC22D TaxID=1962403 RepID=UPI0014386E67|nr:hypothetical protein [Novosphingobium sp. PC22D]
MTDKPDEKATETTPKPRTAGSCTGATTTPPPKTSKAVKGGGIDGDTLRVRHSTHG